MRDTITHQQQKGEVMNEQDKAAFEEWFFSDSSNQCGHPESIAEGAFEAGMAHSNKQAAQAVPVVFNNDSAWDLAQKVRADLDRKSCPGAFMDLAVESINRHYPPQPVQQALAVPVAIERYLWIFEDKHGDKFVQPNVYYTETEASESAKICGNKSIGKASESPIICWELKNTELPAVEQPAAQGDAVHFRAVLCSEQRDKALGVVPKTVGFVDKKAAEQFILEQRDFKGWKYNLEPLYTEAPAVAVNEQMLKALNAISDRASDLVNMNEDRAASVASELAEMADDAIAAAEAAKGGV